MSTGEGRWKCERYLRVNYIIIIIRTSVSYSSKQNVIFPVRTLLGTGATVVFP